MESFADILGAFVQRTLYSHGQLASLSGIPKNTITNWLAGRVQKPQRWEPLLKLAAVLGLSRSETERLLQVAGHQTLASLRNSAEISQLPLFHPWISSNAAPFQAIADLPTFIGRERELQGLQDILLTSNTAPRICIRGMGGVGKTSLAAHLAYKMRPHFPDGVLWARLDTADTLSVLALFASAYGLSVSHHSSIETRSAAVRSLLVDKHVLLILDNAQNSKQVEPLLPPTTQHCGVILTTRQDLAIADGWTQIRLQPFSAESQDAQRLFTRFTSAEFVQRHRQSIEEIAEWVGYLPLALSLLAAQLAQDSSDAHLLAIQQQCRDANQRLSRLQREHRAVRTTFDISFEALTAEQQHGFSLLGVFGGDDMDVAAISTVTQRHPSEIESVLSALQKASLIQLSRSQRFRMHPLLRDFAREKVAQMDEPTAPYARMIQFYIDCMAAAVDPEMQPVASPAHMSDDLGNLLAALDSAVTHHLDALLVTGLTTFFETFHEQGLLSLVEKFVDEALVRVKESLILARLWNLHGRVLWWHGKDSRPSHLKALEIAREHEAVREEVDALKELGAWHNRHSESTLAKVYMQEGLDLARQIDYNQQIVGLLNNLGSATSQLGQFDEALRYFQEGFELAHEIGAHRTQVVLAENLACAAAKRGDLKIAQYYFELGASIGREHHCYITLMGLLGDWGYVAWEMGNLPLAQKVFEESLAIARRTEHWISIAARLSDLAETARLAEEFESAWRYLHEAEQIADQHHLAGWEGLIRLREIKLRWTQGEDISAEMQDDLRAQRGRVHQVFYPELDALLQAISA